MNSWYWENEKLFTISREIQNMLDSGKIKTVVTLSLVATEDPKGTLSLYSAILIYK